MKEYKSQLDFIKEQKNIYKNSEKYLKKKLNIKEKEVNELKNILNTNISIKSQLSSGHEGKEEEKNSKEMKEILPYEECNYNLNMNKKQLKQKSLSLIVRKLYSKNRFNKRNESHMNNSNKSYNNNISKINNNNNGKNNKNYNSNKVKMDYKYKTIANVYSGTSSKRIKNDCSIKGNNNQIIKPFYYSNYHSINSFRGKKIDKSDSRSLILYSKGISKSKIYLPEESNNSKNHLVNGNKSCVNSSQKKNEGEYLLSNKNKIMINYNTNIINTNVSIDRLTVKQKMKDIRKVIDEKINEITRNKNNKIHRTISEIYNQRRNAPFFNNKTRSKRESSLRYNSMYKEKQYSQKSDINTKKKYLKNKYNSNAFRQKKNCTIQHKNKNKKMQNSKTKYKNKSNSMSNLKNKSNEEINRNKNKNNNNKIYSIQPYSMKRLDGSINIYKYNDYKMINIGKNSSNKNNKILSKKNSNPKKKDKNVLNNNHHTIMTNRKINNFNRISLYHEKMSKNSSKSKNQKLDLNSNSNKMNSSLRKFILNKFI